MRAGVRISLADERAWRRIQRALQQHALLGVLGGAQGFLQASADVGGGFERGQGVDDRLAATWWRLAQCGHKCPCGSDALLLERGNDALMMLGRAPEQSLRKLLTSSQMCQQARNGPCDARVGAVQCSQ